MTDYHYASLLTCGHYRETNASWNGVIETGRPSTPIEALCPEGCGLQYIEKFARVEDEPKPRMGRITPLPHLGIVALVEDEPEPCEHEWVDARNEVVISGEVCIKCGAIRATE